MRNQMIAIFGAVKDPRKIDKCTYELGDLMAIALLTYLTGKKDYADMALFAEHSARKFGLLVYTDKSPSSDTFERLFGIIKTNYLERCVTEHGRRVMDIMAEKQIAIDGKKECGTAPREKDSKGDYLLNTYVTENALFIGQEKLTDKENEIPAIPRLLDKLEIKDAIISIDAMGTQVEIAKKIIGMEEHYFLAVKENQAGLLVEIKDVIRHNKPTSTHAETEKEHARVETRTVSIYLAEKIGDKEILDRWQNFKTLVRVDTHTCHVSENGREETRQDTISVMRISHTPVITELWPGGIGLLRMVCTGILMSPSRRMTAAQEKRTPLKICHSSAKWLCRL